MKRYVTAAHESVTENMDNVLLLSCLNTVQSTIYIVLLEYRSKFRIFSAEIHWIFWVLKYILRWFSCLQTLWQRHWTRCSVWAVTEMTFASTLHGLVLARSPGESLRIDDIQWKSIEFPLISIDFPLIFIDFHWFSLILIEFHWFSSISIDLHCFSMILSVYADFDSLKSMDRVPKRF